MIRAALLAVLLVSATALAQKPPQAPADPAKIHVEQGVALYKDGNYSAALAEFEAAYAITPAPYILNDIGLAQKGLFRYTEAIASLRKYLAASTGLAPDLRKQTEQIIAELEALLSPVTFDVKPAGAHIALDSRPLATAPVAEPLPIAAGSHTLDVTADGYQPDHREFVVAASTPLSLTIALAPIVHTGTLHVTTLPRGTVTIDGRPVGIGDIRAQLEAGGHTLDITAPGYVRHHEELMLGAGQDRDLAVHLDATRAWYGRWYVWVPATVIVVGVITAITIDKTTHESPLDGTLGLGKAQ